MRQTYNALGGEHKHAHVVPHQIHTVIKRVISLLESFVKAEGEKIEEGGGRMEFELQKPNKTPYCPYISQHPVCICISKTASFRLSISETGLLQVCIGATVWTDTTWSPSHLWSTGRIRLVQGHNSQDQYTAAGQTSSAWSEVPVVQRG